MRVFRIISLLLFSFAFVSTEASNYPRESYYQRVYMQDIGPYTAIRVANVCMNKWLLVYRAGSPLLAEGPEKLEAHVFSNCESNGQVTHRQHQVIPMGRDWSGSWNYYTPELSLGSLQNLRCMTVANRNAEVAFHLPTTGVWDSDYSKNYAVPLLAIQRLEGYNTRKGGCQHINPEAYDYIRKTLSR